MKKVQETCGTIFWSDGHADVSDIFKFMKACQLQIRIFLFWDLKIKKFIVKVSHF